MKTLAKKIHSHLIAQLGRKGAAAGGRPASSPSRRSDCIPRCIRPVHTEVVSRELCGAAGCPGRSPHRTLMLVYDV